MNLPPISVLTDYVEKALKEAEKKLPDAKTYPCEVYKILIPIPFDLSGILKEDYLPNGISPNITRCVEFEYKKNELGKWELYE